MKEKRILSTDLPGINSILQGKADERSIVNIKMDFKSASQGSPKSNLQPNFDHSPEDARERQRREEKWREIMKFMKQNPYIMMELMPQLSEDRRQPDRPNSGEEAQHQSQQATQLQETPSGFFNRRKASQNRSISWNQGGLPARQSASPVRPDKLSQGSVTAPQA